MHPRIADITSRLRATTPGDWKAETDERNLERHGRYSVDLGTEIVGYDIRTATTEIVGCEGILGDGSANAEFIANAGGTNGDVAFLLSEYKRMHRALAIIREILNDGWGGGINEQSAHEKISKITNLGLGGNNA